MITNTLRRWLEGIKQGTKQVTPLGSAITDAAQIGDNAVAYVTTADGTKGIKLPAKALGPITVINTDASNALKVWPQSGDSINTGSASAVYSQAAKSCVTYYPTPGTSGVTNWYGVVGAAMA